VLKRLFALVILLGFLGAGLYYSKLLPKGFLPKNLGPVARHLEEAKVTGAVKAALRLNRLTKDGGIDVSSEDGVVTLRGEVGSEEARQAADQVAAAVPAVRQVVSHLKVVTLPAPSAEGRSLGESLDDRALEVGVRLALSLRRELQGSDIEVQAFRRQVTLTGEVRSDATRRAAVQTARDTAGVIGVTDDLRLPGAPPGEPSSGARREAAERAVAANPHLARYGIRVAEMDGRLVLRGRVRTGAEKDLAGVLAREAAPGPIENALQIRP
jgi:osmotically-inducible protein OsmY